MDGAAVLAAFAKFEAARDAIAALPLQSLSVPQLLTVIEMRERGRRRDLAVDHAFTAHLTDSAKPHELGATSIRALLATRLRISSRDARERLTDAAQLGPRHTTTGERVQTELSHTAAAVARGDISVAHVRIIQEFIKKLPVWVSFTRRDDYECDLVGHATTLGPEDFRKVAEALLGFIDQDGTEPDHATQQRRREIRVGRQQADGMSRIEGWLTPEARALWDVIAAKHAAPGTNLPHDDAASGRDDRTTGQRHHDALARAMGDIVASGTLGQIAGVPATTTINELERAAGWAHTGSGNRLPIRDLIRMAAESRHYLAVFDDHTEEVLYLGRAKRTATTAQRLALFARDKGCTHPGCTVPFYWTQAHHTPDHSEGGKTDLPDLTLACQPANQLIEKTGWTTHRPGNGRTYWIPLTHHDTGQSRVNHHFHPQRYLTDHTADGDHGGDDEPG
ncbi:HNH nuclease [Mycobacterium sp. IS-1496]|uniref:HNH endonuclease signature motif containing protein n=1 Tax=Mycobacterium sp. IS-1496 TaxID=1772284 RepID=UPI0007415693|nr:HNH endonuclease signature motif containing protein [Mycobacterium sp. IS-1496]KUI38845.1 HNH nuclease [Mycobacterium sp. IS-1496]